MDYLYFWLVCAGLVWVTSGAVNFLLAVHDGYKPKFRYFAFGFIFGLLTPFFPRDEGGPTWR